MHDLKQLVTGFVLFIAITAINMEPVQKNVFCSNHRTPEGYLFQFNGGNTSKIDIHNESHYIATCSPMECTEFDKSAVKSMTSNSFILYKCSSLKIYKDLVLILEYNATNDEESQEPYKTPSTRPPEQRDNLDNTSIWKILAYVVCGIGVCGICVLAPLCIHWKKRRNNPGRPPQRDVEMNEFRDGQGGQQQESEENENNQETERALLHLFRVTTDVQNPGEQENRHTNGGPRLPNGARCSHGDTEETDVLVDKQVQGNQSNDNRSSENSCGREEQPNGVEFAGQKYDQ